MAKSFVLIKLVCTVFFLSITSSVSAAQYKDTVLISKTYSGQRLTESEEDHFKLSAVAGEPVYPKNKTFYNTTKLPLLIGLSIDKIKPYVRMSGPFFDSPLVEDESRIAQFKVEDVQLSKFHAKKVSATEIFYYPSTEDYVREVESVGYYIHDGNSTISNFIFHNTLIFNPDKTPYYQEIRKKFKHSNNALFKEKQSQINHKKIKFYHLKRSDGYIESYGFYKIPDRYNFAAKSVLIFQGLYPKSQKNLATKKVRRLLKEHLKNIQRRDKILSNGL